MSFLPVGFKKAAQSIEYGWTQPKSLLNWHGAGAAVHTLVMCLFVKRFPVLLIPVCIGAYQLLKAMWWDRILEFKVECIDGVVKTSREK